MTEQGRLVNLSHHLPFNQEHHFKLMKGAC